MSVAHELSSEIAAAILARKEETHKLKELKEVVLRVHSVVQKLTVHAANKIVHEPSPNERPFRIQPIEVFYHRA